MKTPLVRRHGNSRIGAGLDEQKSRRAKTSFKATRTKGKVPMACPGDFKPKAGYTGAAKKLCATKLEKQPNCTWSEADENVVVATKASCLGGNQVMTVDACSFECVGANETCTFAYTSDGGCMVYEKCDETEPEASWPEPMKSKTSLDWGTCERFINVWYDKAAALHNEEYNRFLIIAKNEDLPPPNGQAMGNQVTRTYYEIGLDKLSKLTV